MKKFITLLLSVILLASCNVMSDDSDSNGSSEDVTTLTVQVSVFRDDYGNYDYVNRDYSVILTKTKVPSDIISEVNSKTGYVQSGKFDSEMQQYTPMLTFNFEDLDAGEYYLYFLIDYDFDDTYTYSEVYDSSEMIIYGSTLINEANTDYYTNFPKEAPVSVLENVNNFIYFDLDINIILLES